MSRPRLVVKAKTRTAILKLRGPVFGNSEDAVVSKLLEVHATLQQLAMLANVTLDKPSGAPTNMQSSERPT